MKKVIETAKVSTKHLKESTIKFKEEFKKTVGASLVAAFGLVVGLAWKEVVETYLNTIITPTQSKFFSAIIITIISVAAIMIISKIMAPHENENVKKEI